LFLTKKSIVGVITAAPLMRVRLSGLLADYCLFAVKNLAGRLAALLGALLCDVFCGNLMTLGHDRLLVGFSGRSQ
jgi:hypothetical protein